MIEPIDIVALWESRRRAQGGHIARMLEVKTMYDGEILVPLPELDEDERPGVANLLLQGVDQLGMRASNPGPDILFPPTSKGSDRAKQQARLKREAALGWWDMNSKQKKDARRARFLVAYGCAPTIIKPVGSGVYQKRKMPYWHVLDPLCVFPAHTSDKDDIEPRDVVVQRHVTLGWLQDRYPAQAGRLYKGPSDRNGIHPKDTKFTLLEYNDAQETVMVVCGSRNPRPGNNYMDPSDGVTRVELLERTPNLAEMCLAVVPGRITLGQLMGHFDQIIGMFLAEAKLTAYENIAIQKHIFPELWAVSHPNSPTSVRIVRVADGKQGYIGEVEGGTIMPVTLQPGQMASAAVDRMERAMRIQAGIPSEWGGESATNIRTAKRGQEVMSAASDPTLAELQTILAEATEAEMTRAIAVEKAWYGKFTLSFHQSRTGRNVGDTFTPNELFDTDYCEVRYSMPGVDAAGIPIELGQRTQTGIMSVDTARRLDPMVDDPDYEKSQVEIEGLRMALLKGLEARAQQGTIDPHEIALIIKLKQAKDSKEIEEAVLMAQEQIQQQQADQQQAEPGSPETQPGMSEGAAQGAQAQGPPPLAQMLQGLRIPNQVTPAETAAAG